MKIALISCTKNKRIGKMKAKELYSASTLFKNAYAYAIQNCDAIFILSAKHGLLSPIDIISNYEETLNNKSKSDRIKWSLIVVEQLKSVVNKNDQLVFLCGKKYREFLQPEFKNSTCPVQGLKLGQMLKFYINDRSIV